MLTGSRGFAASGLCRSNTEDERVEVTIHYTRSVSHYRRELLSSYATSLLL